MKFVDYYSILGITKAATAKEIKSAYRKLARKHHPDLNPDDKEAKSRFQQINEANEVLSDPESRKKYDQYGKDWKHGEEAEKSRQYQEQNSNSRGARYSEAGPEGDFSDFFESMFGRQEATGRRRQVKYRGEDYQTELNLDLIEAYETRKQTITVNGKTLRITIPAGIENGQTIKIPGHGGPGRSGGPNGDLYIKFAIANHPRFKRLGDNLFTSIELDLYTAILGGELTLETLDGKVKLQVKPETQNGSKVKLKGKGFPVYKKEGQFGDLFITYTVKIPHRFIRQAESSFYRIVKVLIIKMKAVQTKHLVAISEFCQYHDIEISFISSLQQNGLIEITTVREEKFLELSQLQQIEKFIRFYQELDINLEGIETISHLLEHIKTLQQEVIELKNRLGVYESNE